MSVGRVVPSHAARILDERGSEVSEGRVGTLSFRGPSIMKGYYNREDATEAIRRGDGFLDSGDRAFLYDGELYITGRSKDLIIRAGRNLMPQEIEREVAEIDGVRRGCVAAFGVPDPSTGTEKVVVVAETREDGSEARAHLAQTVASRLVEHMGVPPDDVRLVPPRTIPKTSSGKLRRGACRDLYLRGELSRGATKSWLFWVRAAWLSAAARSKRAVRTSVSVAFGVYAWLLSALFIGLGWVAVWLIPSRALFQRFVRRAARIYLPLSGIRFDVEGAERLAGSGPSVVISNHASYLDPIPLIATLQTDCAFVVKNEAASWPLFGRFIRKLGYLPVEREAVDESVKSTDAMRALLDSGRSVILFPEGTFSYATGIRPFKLGAFKLAADAGCPLVPVGLVGTRRWLRDGTWLPRRSRLQVVIGEPRVVKDGSFAGLVGIKEETAEWIADAVGEPRLDLVSAGPAAT